MPPGAAAGDSTQPHPEPRARFPMLEWILTLGAGLSVPFSDWLPNALSPINLGPTNSAEPWLGGFMVFAALKTACRTYDFLTEIVNPEARRQPTARTAKTVHEAETREAGKAHESKNACQIQVYADDKVEVHMTMTDKTTEGLLLRLEPETARCLAEDIARAADVAEEGTGSSGTTETQANEGTTA